MCAAALSSERERERVRVNDLHSSTHPWSGARIWCACVRGWGDIKKLQFYVLSWMHGVYRVLNGFSPDRFPIVMHLEGRVALGGGWGTSSAL